MMSMNNEKTKLVTVLNDGETFSDIQGTMIAVVPDDIEDDEVETFLKEGDYDHFMLEEVTDSNTLMLWFTIFFPGMQVEEDNDGQLIIYTGITESDEEEE